MPNSLLYQPYQFAKALAGLGLFLAPMLQGHVVINEILASNGTGATDEDGDYEDWIELYNLSSTAHNLAGYGLSDDPGRPFRWSFPEVVIGPNQFLRVWASGKDRRDAVARLHTNFSISAAGEPLLLTMPSGIIADLVPATMLQRDISHGRQPDGEDSWVFFASPTPAAANTTQAYTAILEPPAFSHSSGFYSESFSLSLDHPDPEVQIVYSLDGSDPLADNVGGKTYPYKDSYQQFPSDPAVPLSSRTIDSYVYADEINISDRSDEPNRIANLAATFERSPGTFTSWGNHRPADPVYKGTTVRARAFKPGAIPSSSSTHNYYFDSGSRARFTLPMVSLSINEDDLFDYYRGIYVPGVLFDQWRASNPTRNAGQGLPGNYRRRGDEWEYPAHLEWFDASGKPVLSQDIGVRIHGGYARDLPRKFLRLYANGNYGLQEFAYPFFADMPEITSFRRLVLRFGDKTDNYLADVTAAAIMSAGKAGVQATQPVIQFLNGEYHGVTFLRERLDRFYVASRYQVDPDNVVMLEPRGNGSTGDLTEGLPQDLGLYRELFNHITNKDPRSGENYRFIKDRLDIDSYIDYYHMFIFINNGDWGGGNKHTMFWRVREPDGSAFGDGRWRMLIWDFDGAARDDGPSASRNDARDMVDQAINKNSNRAMLNRLLLHPEFRTRFINRMADHMNTTFHIDRISPMAQFEFDRIAPEMPEHFDRWDHPGKEDTPDRWVQFAQRRPAHVRDHLRNHFQVGEDAHLELDISHPEGGYLVANTIAIRPETPGVPVAPYPWTGIYFKQVPVTLTAVPDQDFRFAGWVELPGETSTTITFNPQATDRRTAIFEPLPSRHLLHYWDFNTPIKLLDPTMTTAAASIEITEGPLTEVTYASGQQFRGDNARLSSQTGTHLRVNNPLGTSLTLRLPTTGASYPVFRYETRRSGQGAGIQEIHYSLDGSHFQLLHEIIVHDSAPAVVNLNLAHLAGAAANPDFALRIAFQQGDGGIAGNNRFDNLTLEAIPHQPQSIFTTNPTIDLGDGWKWNRLGHFYDRHFPFVYFIESNSWIYALGTSETSYFFHLFSAGQWGWGSSTVYPLNYLYDSAGGQWRYGM